MHRTTTDRVRVDRRRGLPGLGLAFALALAPATAGAGGPAAAIDFNRDIRPILSENCFTCHGPDAAERKGVSKPFRLDTAEGLAEDLGGYASVVPGDPDESELIRRVESDDPLDAMPPPKLGKTLKPREVGLLREWVRQGAPYARHWSYVKPTRPDVPEVARKGWPKNPVDNFLLYRLEKEGMEPSPEADRSALLRRAALDLTGLPPAPEELDAFLEDDAPDAYEKAVDRLLARPAYGEHWARMWLDLARYADSAGYADDPPRTIWAYRDWVIRALNANMPFDRFTVDQIAGDLVPEPTEDQLIATAFHRNTMTNNEGGTNDEEFRNVAVVDRVNTTMAVWMGTTMACAQCHDHKYDPIPQRDYFRLFAILNNTEDADRTDESPTLPLYSDEQRSKKAGLEREAAELVARIRAETPEARAGLECWEKGFGVEPEWRTLRPRSLSAEGGGELTVLDDDSIRSASKAPNDAYAVEAPLAGGELSAIRLEALPDDDLPGKGPGLHDGNFVVTRVVASIVPAEARPPVGRYVRVDLPGEGKILSLAEVQVFRGAENVATKGEARQSSTDFGGEARRAVDGKTDGRYEAGQSTTHTSESSDPWWELDLGEAGPVDRVVVWNRTDGNLQSRLAGARVSILDADRQAVWSRELAEAPERSVELPADGGRALAFAAAFATHEQGGFEAATLLDAKGDRSKGWAIGGKTGRRQALTLALESPVDVEPGSVLKVTIEQRSKHLNHVLGRFRLAATDDARAGDFARTPEPILALLRLGPDGRSEAQQAELLRHYLDHVAPETEPDRARLKEAREAIAAIKPETTVPIYRERPASDRRVTHIQLRGNYLNHGDEVGPGTPEAFHPLPEGREADRLALAEWLVSPENPLTARVIANRYWEQIFGVGLVPTSEEFGAQGEPPTNPELLDWLAVELVEGGWDLKRFLRLLVTSAAYRQDSRVTPELVARDPDNQLLARGPRFRLSAETIRDQALFVAGLLSPKMYGPPVKPPQPSLGLNAAFGSMIDWTTSDGDDRYRRGLYTTWRRSNPYPSMATFDAPSREVCTVKRTRTNTPLQALVTLNDPVYVEAAQALARRVVAGADRDRDRAALGVRLCLARDPSPAELDRLVGLLDEARGSLAGDRASAEKLATEPLGALPEGADPVELAAWTVVGNVLLNLDETLMKR